MKILLISLLLSNPVSSDTIHDQWAVYVAKTLSGVEGRIHLTDKKLIFKSKKGIRRRKNISLRYKDIIKIRRKWESIIPNRILIVDKSGNRYTFIAFGRKKIIRTVKNKVTTRVVDKI